MNSTFTATGPPWEGKPIYVFCLLLFACLFLSAGTAEAQTNITTCSGKTVRLTATMPYYSQSVRWRRSTDNGYSWTTVDGPYTTNYSYDFYFNIDINVSDAHNGYLYEANHYRPAGYYGGYYYSAGWVDTPGSYYRLVLTTKPSVTDGSRCGPGTVTLYSTLGQNATRNEWYDAQGYYLGTGTSYTTPWLTASRTYYVYSYNSNTGCYSDAVAVTATINAVPGAPTVTGASRKGAGSVTLTAAGTPSGGSYRWYTVATGGTAIAGATGSSYNTPNLSATTTYYVATRSSQGCESTRTAVTATIDSDPTYTSPYPAYARLALSNGRTVATVTDPDGAVTNAVVSGAALPTFLSLNPVTGEIKVNTGTVTSGVYTRNITITDAKGGVSTVPVTITINEDLYQASGSAMKLGTDCYQLTSAAQTQQGQVWRVSTIDLTKSFEVSFNLNLGNDMNGADGVVFGFQRVATDPAFVTGAVGEGLGFQGITPSLGIEFDTYRNTGETLTADHIAIFKNGDVANPVVGAVQMSSTKLYTKDGLDHAVRVVWSRETNVLQVYFDGVLRTQYASDIITDIFGGNKDVYFGFTASTGALTNIQSVCQIQYNIIPATNPVTTASIPATNISTIISPFSGSDTAPGFIAKYIVRTLPASGTLYLNATVLAVGSEVLAADVNNLRYDPVDNASGNITFTYAAVDNQGYEAAAATYTIPVNGRPSTPTDSNTGANTVAENAPDGTAVGITARSTDPESGSITYTLAGNAGGRFSINSSTGVVTVANGALLDFETATSHSITVHASDGVNAPSTQTFTINVTNINEAPVITSNGSGATASVSIAENTTAVTTVTSTDPENNTRTYSITGGVDAAKFSINSSTGVLAFVSAPNFEDPGDTGTDNVYHVTVRASDGSLYDEQAIAVTVTNVNEAPVAYNVAHNAPIINTNVFVNLSAVLSATDPDGEAPVSFRLSNIPAASVGALRVNGVAANTTTDYDWSLRNTFSFDPVNTTIADVVFNYTVKDAAGAVSNSATYTIPMNDYPRTQNITNTATLANTDGETLLNALGAADSDGTISTFRFPALPSAAQGILYVDGVAAVAGQYYDWPAKFDKISFDPASPNTADVTFRFSVVDSEGGETDTVYQGNFTIPINGAPVANDVTNAATLSSSAGTTLLDALSGSDPDGTVSFFSITTLPASAQGILYIDGIAATANTDYAWSKAGTLSLDPAFGNSAAVTFMYTVKDNEGAVDASPATFTINIMLDFDLDGIADAIDLDDDNDGIPDTLEGSADTDGDGIINSFDLDSDGDGILDAVEANNGIMPLAAVFSSGTGRYTASVGSNGLADILETTPGSGTSNYTLPDTDNDGIPDYLDVDADNDGLLDNLEAQGTRLLARGSDSDKDGIDDQFDPTCGCAAPGATLMPVDTDTDGIPDYLDLDSDNDLYPDTAEAFDINNNGKSIDDLKEMVNSFILRAGAEAFAGVYNFTDGDRNFSPDMFDDYNSNGRLNFLEPVHMYYLDTNNNGWINLFDAANFGVEPVPNYAFRNAAIIIPLPVSLVRFTATAGKGGVSLNWETATEKDNDFFEVERSRDGKTFYKLSRVDGAGNSKQKQSYTFFDQQAPEGMLYYRLKQVDFNGTYAYSPIATVEIKQALAVKVLLYPNPAASYIKLDLTMMPAAAYKIRILSVDGRLLDILETKDNALQEINVQELSTGKYIIQVQGAALLKTVSFIKK